jgi:hypothetical protein
MANIQGGFRVLTAIFYVSLIGFFITATLALGIWGVSRISVEREYLTLNERVRFAVAYADIVGEEKKLGFVRDQLGLREPVVQLSTSLASECQAFFTEFESYIMKTNGVLAAYATEGRLFDSTQLTDTDFIRVEVYTRTAVELITRYHECTRS